MKGSRKPSNSFLEHSASIKPHEGVEDSLSIVERQIRRRLSTMLFPASRRLREGRGAGEPLAPLPGGRGG